MSRTATFDTHHQDTLLNHRSGQTVTVLKEVDQSKYDRDDIGIMYVVTFEDGTEVHAFADELTFDTEEDA